jgi:hypothetical protein
MTRANLSGQGTSRPGDIDAYAGKGGWPLEWSTFSRSVADRAIDHLRSHRRAAHLDVVEIPAAVEDHLREERELRRLEKMIDAIEAATPQATIAQHTSTRTDQSKRTSTAASTAARYCRSADGPLRKPQIGPPGRAYLDITTPC